MENCQNAICKNVKIGQLQIAIAKLASCKNSRIAKLQIEIVKLQIVNIGNREIGER